MTRKLRTADLTTPELDPQGDVGDVGTYSTTQLPQTGHEDAVDDGQQRCASELRKISASLRAKNKYAARRLHVLANQLDGGDSKFSTAALPETGHDSDMSGTPRDADQVGGKLQVFDTKPAKKGTAGPEPRSASRKAAPQKGAKKLF